MNDKTPEEFDNTLSESLQTRWPARAITERQVATLLTNIETQNRKFTLQTRVSNLFRPVAFVGGLALLVLALSWIFGSMRPNPSSEITPIPTPLSTLAGDSLPLENLNPSATPTPAVDLPTPSPIPPIADLPSTGFTSFPNVTFDFAVPFPDAPPQITLYRQQLEGEVTAELAQHIAAQLGITGQVTSYPGEGGEPIVEIVGAEGNVRFLSFPGQFVYSRFETAEGEPLPFDQRVALAEEFLNARGLLTMPYRTTLSDFSDNSVRFVALLDGYPVIYSIGYNRNPLEWITVSVDPAGVVDTVFHSAHTFQPVGEFPILTAEEAWERVATRGTQNRAMYAIQGAPINWTRPATERPAEPYTTFTGWLTMADGQPTLSGEIGNLIVPSLPEDIIMDIGVEVRGTVANGVLEWAEIAVADTYNSYGMSLSCMMGGGGGGPLAGANFGGGNFARVSPDPSTPPATGYISPIQPGDVIEGIVGEMTVLDHIYPDGARGIEIYLYFSGDETTPGWQAMLEGAIELEVAELNQLPIKLWGTVDRLDVNGLPIIRVTQVEEAYPGLRIQAWLGTTQAITLEEKEVMLFTTIDGVSYVLNSSIQWGADMSGVGLPGDRLLLEGYILPGHTFGGYPVIYERSMEIANERTDLDGYTIQSNRISVQDDTLSPEISGLTLTGHVTIEQVELVYSTISLETCSPAILNAPGFESFLYVQPIWRFTGHFDDGRIFEIQIQALPDEYLR
ncbi:MAG: hypothetical protein Fur0022_31200 [Anaerolineales bacterium]